MVFNTFYKRFIFAAGGLVLLLFVTNRLLFFNKGFFENVASLVWSPALRLGGTLTSPLKNFFAQKVDYQTLASSYAAREVENALVMAENIKLNALLNRTQETKDSIEFQRRYLHDQGILSKIVFRNFSPEEHYFFLNRGEREGVKKDMIALHDAQLVGRVSEVYPYHCKLILISDSTCKVSAYTAGTKAQGIVIGKNIPNSCSLAYVSHLAPIVDHDIVLSSGQGMIFPEGFCLGRITRHELKDLCHTIELKPIIDFTKLEFCILLDRSLIVNF